jgi:hypothetical protein
VRSLYGYPVPIAAAAMDPAANDVVPETVRFVILMLGVPDSPAAVPEVLTEFA